MLRAVFSFFPFLPSYRNKHEKPQDHQTSIQLSAWRQQCHNAIKECHEVEQKWILHMKSSDSGDVDVSTLIPATGSPQIDRAAQRDTRKVSHQKLSSWIYVERSGCVCSEVNSKPNIYGALVGSTDHFKLWLNSLCVIFFFSFFLKAVIKFHIDILIWVAGMVFSHEILNQIAWCWGHPGWPDLSPL